MTSLELVLLGGFQARVAGQPVDVPGRKERALLAFLAMPPGEPRSRDRLCGLLWGDRGDKQAHDSLKQAVLRLRKSFNSVLPLPVLADRGSLTLDRAAVAVDVQEFEQLIGEGTLDAVARATALYRGDLLDGLDVRDPAFEEWLVIERQRLRDMAREAMGTLLDQHMVSNAHAHASAVARRLLALDPLRETAHRALMRIHSAQGQTALALKQYQSCRDALQKVLGVRPEIETERLYQSIQAERAKAWRTNIEGPPVERSAESSPAIDTAPRQHDADPEAPSAKPSIAVLPFSNLSGDPEQTYFSDGITEDILVELSRNHALLVIDRDSSFQYRDRTVDAKRVGRELGVQYVAEGSVRKKESHVRIAVRLIDTATGHHLWAERYDRELELQAVFAIQDEVTAAIVAAVAGQVQAAGIDRVRRKRTGSLAAYDFFLRGLAHFNRSGDDDTVPARDMFSRAIEVDPDFAQAHALLAELLVEVFWTDLVPYVQGEAHPTLDHALRAAQRAVALDGADSRCHCALSYVHVARKSFDLAADHLDLAARLNRNDSECIVQLGMLEMLRGRPTEALRFVDRAMTLNPIPPNYYWIVQGLALYHLRRYDAACRAFERATARRPYVNRYLAACHAQLGRFAEAHALVAESLRLQPTFSLRLWQMIEPYESRADLDHMLDGLRKAGSPE